MPSRQTAKAKAKLALLNVFQRYAYAWHAAWIRWAGRLKASLNIGVGQQAFGNVLLAGHKFVPILGAASAAIASTNASRKGHGPWH